jgi:hypothetical protein
MAKTIKIKAWNATILLAFSVVMPWYALKALAIHRRVFIAGGEFYALLIDSLYAALHPHAVS